ncbi:MAG: CHAT domain-containing protein [Coleofasciculaceae cyanobacterium]
MAQGTQARQAEADRLAEQHIKQMQARQWDTAIATAQQAIKIFYEIGNRPGEANMWGNIGIAYRAKGYPEQSLPYIEKALKIMQEIGNYRGQSLALQQLGLTYKALGENEKVEKVLEQMVVVAQKSGDRGMEANALNNLGLNYLRLGKNGAALASLEKQLEIVKSLNDRPGQARAIGNLGLVYDAMGRYDQAIAAYEQELAISRELGTNRNAEGYIQGKRAPIYRLRGEYGKAIEATQQFLASARANQDRNTERVALSNLGSFFYETRKFAEASEALFAAIEIDESVREKLDEDLSKISVFEGQVSTYNVLQLALIAQNKTSEALEVAERGRAQAFVELLSKRLNSNAPSQTPRINIQQIQQIAREQNATLVEYSVVPQSSELLIWVIKPTGELNFRTVKLNSQVQGEQVSLKLDTLVDDNLQAIRDKVSSLGQLRGNDSSLTISAGDRVRLKNDVLNSEAWEVIAVDAQSRMLTVRYPSWEPGAKIPRPITDVTKVERSNSSSSNAKKPYLQELHRLLIEPVAEFLPTDPNARVIFIPHGKLFFVPFPALQDSNGQYLIQKHTILTAPAIQVLQLTRQQRQRVSGSAQDVLVVGNPMPNKIGSLPEAENEANEIARILNTKAITGNQATKAAILQQMPKARLIHLAAHGTIDNVQGLDSAIALGSSGNDNGQLTASDILKDLKLNAELVVLSACDTGRGRLTGDGVIGLSRSLFAAGVPSVIVSLWTVPDDSTSELMTEFYRQLQGNPDKAQALRQAMLRTMNKYQDPWHWAAFTLIGEAQ